MNYSLIKGDCLTEMRDIPDASVDMILCDLPYGTTRCAWDSVIPFEPLWEQYRRVAKENAAIVLTAAQPFTTALIASNYKDFRYCWYWKKSRATGFANAKKQPLRCFEDVAVFYRKPPTYNPQGLTRVEVTRRNNGTVGGDTLRQDTAGTVGRGTLRTPGAEYVQEFTGYPKQLLAFNSAYSTVHPTQKPVELMEYLIRTYTMPGQTVLDNCMGSGTTGVAAIQASRRFIGIEKDSKYFDIARERLDAANTTELAA